jgi:isopenicillin N synthase-like dioxygenase
MSALPIIDLRQFNTADALGERLVAVCKTQGFFYLVGHEISEELVDRLFKMSRDFFLETPLEEKLQYSSQSGEPVSYSLILPLPCVSC